MSDPSAARLARAGEGRLIDYALGGAVVALRSRGYRWDEIARALELFDTITARRLAVAYLVRLTQTHGERAGEVQGQPATEGPAEMQRTAREAG